MPFKRKYNTATKRSAKRTRSRYLSLGLRRKFRPYGALNTRVHAFKRVAVKNLAAISNVADVFGALTFSLTDLPDFAEFQNLYDNFRICAVKVRLVPTITSNDSNAPANALRLFNIHTVVDHNDSTAATSMNELMQYRTYKMTRGTKEHIRYFKPSVLLAAYESAVGTAYTPKWKQWLDMQDTGTPHYCLKYGIDQVDTADTDIRVRCYVTYYFQCKDVK